MEIEDIVRIKNKEEIAKIEEIAWDSDNMDRFCGTIYQNLRYGELE